MKYLIVLFILFAVEVRAMPAQVIIISNAEIITSGTNTGLLSQKGLERAGALAPYFLQTSELLGFGPPATIFAARPNLLDNTIRCIQTVTPTSAVLRLPVHSPYGSGQEDQLVNLILNNKRYDGQNILICWQQDRIFALIEAFGYTSPISSYPDCCFDYTFVMTFPITAASPVATVMHQNLLFGDPDGTCSSGTCGL